MKVAFTQIYPEEGVNFPLSHDFQRRMTQEISALVSASPQFVKKFGDRSTKVIIYISSRESTVETTMKGPKSFRNGDVESYLFLPFKQIVSSLEPFREFLRELMIGIRRVLAVLELDSGRIDERAEALIDSILGDASMLDGEWPSIVVASSLN